MSFETPETLPEFFDRLAMGIFPAGIEPPDDYVAFRRQCEARYEAGLDIFGDAYKERDNRAEGLEEAADAANYAAFDHFNHFTREGNDDDLALVLTAAAAAYQMHKAFRDLAARRRGVPA